jgi:ATP-dependent Clp protease ATP-binding subunit ClpA
MKRLRTFIKNMYRVAIIKPGKIGQVIDFEQVSQSNADEIVDAMLKRMVTNDSISLETDVEMQKMLEQRVANKRNSGFMAKNSFAELLLPLFSFKHLELKMIAVTVLLVIALGIDPVGNHSVNRSMSPAFLADTLIDSSRLNVQSTFDSTLDINR